MYCKIYTKGELDINDSIIRNGLKMFAYYCAECGAKTYGRRCDYKNNKSGRCKRCCSKNKSTSTSRLYRIWAGMNQRCYNKKNPKYDIYGGKSIIVYEKWRADFEEFATWSFLNNYKDSHTIDRIDSNKGYNPDNCRWVDIFTQNQNIHTNKNNKSGHRNIKFIDNGYRVVIRRDMNNLCDKRFKRIEDAIIYRDLILRDYDGN